MIGSNKYELEEVLVMPKNPRLLPLENFRVELEKLKVGPVVTSSVEQLHLLESSSGKSAIRREQRDRLLNSLLHHGPAAGGKHLTFAQLRAHNAQTYAA